MLPPAISAKYSANYFGSCCIRFDAANGTCGVFGSIAPPSGIALVNRLGFDRQVGVIIVCLHIIHMKKTFPHYIIYIINKYQLIEILGDSSASGCGYFF